MEKSILGSAKKLFQINHQEGFSENLKLDYFFTMPSPNKYPFQWFWDSCFHAIVLSKLDTRSAKKELECLLQLQRRDGFIPHVIFWRDIDLSQWTSHEKHPEWKRIERHPSNKYITAMIQPPVLSLAVEKIYEADKDLNFVKHMLPKIESFHKYLRQKRDPDLDNLISIIQSRESGLDFSPQYDELFRNPKNFKETIIASDKIFEFYKSVKWNLNKIWEKDLFNVEDVLFNVIYVKALEALARLYLMVGNQGKADMASDDARGTEAAIIEKMWNKEDETFYSLAGRDEKHMRIKTISSLLPLWLNLPTDKEKALIAQLKDEKLFWPSYPAPSTALSEPSFDPNHSPWIWRGPTWINTNWMLYHALKEKNYPDLARTIKGKSLELVKKNGFREHYNPLTGMGEGEDGFGWSTLVLDMD